MLKQLQSLHVAETASIERCHNSPSQRSWGRTCAHCAFENEREAQPDLATEVARLEYAHRIKRRSGQNVIASNQRQPRRDAKPLRGRTRKDRRLIASGTNALWYYMAQ
jgi:hypothetical protein